MITFIRAQKNTTIYSKHKLLNTGADEIIEIRGGFSHENGPDVARSLIQFDLESLSNNVIADESKFFLNLKIIQKTELGNEFEIEFFPLAESWSEGVGRYIDSEHNYPGASWSYRKENKTWSALNISEVDSGGGSWFTSTENELGNLVEFSKSQKFEKIATDIRIDITDYVKFWTSNLIKNNGMIIKFKDDTLIHDSCVKFFSKNTNTIYEPYLEVATNDYIFEPIISTQFVDTVYNANTNSGSLNSGSLNSGSLNSGSLNSGSLNSGSLNSGSLNSGSLNSGSLNSGSLNSGSINTILNSNDDCSKDFIELTCDEVLPKIKYLKKEYKNKSVNRINLGVRERFPVKKFTNRMRYTLENFTRSDMFYSVRDAETDEILIDFSEFTKISCDSKGHFFKFDFGCCSLGRFYKFVIKVEDETTNDIHIDQRVFSIIE